MASAITPVLLERARVAGVEIPSSLVESLTAYYDLLARWNAKINLTALSDPAAAVDRLLLEPLLAARVLPARPQLMDLGSGGGSPAIPLALALGATLLVMVESRTRKAAFLREAARTVNLNTVVEASRFEDVAKMAEFSAKMDVVSIRAVRMDPATLDIASSFAKRGGVLALFTSGNLVGDDSVDLIGNSKLIKLNVPRGTIRLR